MIKNKIKQVFGGLFLGLFLLFLFLSSFFTIGLLYLQSHEQIHWKIYQRYDIDSYIQYDSLLLSAKTEANPNELFKCNDSCKLHHALNDIIGYNTRVLLFQSWALFLIGIILIYIIFRKRGQNV